MALKPTIFKAQIALSDSDRNCFEELSLTVAQHPSETTERMTARIITFCLHSARGLQFTRGLSTADEPDLWLRSDSGETLQWIELGQPEEPRLRKACGRAQSVSVYAFGKSADTWWNINGTIIRALPRVQIWKLPWVEVEQASQLISRTMKLGVSIVGGTVYLDDGSRSTSLEPELLHRADDFSTCEN